jgi:hypothetical protein
MGWQAVWSIFLWFGKLTPDAYASLSSIGLLGYMGGNVGEHFAKRGKDAD